MAQKQVKDGHVYFPNPDGVFDLHVERRSTPHAELIVEGEPIKAGAGQST